MTTSFLLLWHRKRAPCHARAAPFPSAAELVRLNIRKEHPPCHPNDGESHALAASGIRPERHLPGPVAVRGGRGTGLAGDRDGVPVYARRPGPGAGRRGRAEAPPG